MRTREIKKVEHQPNFKIEMNFCIFFQLFSISDGQQLLDVLEPYGGWPVVKGDEWDADSWNWLEMIKNMSNDGLYVNYILGVSVTDDFENPTKNVIFVRK